METEIREFVSNPATKYVAATLVGFLAAFLVERLNRYIDDQRTRSVLRESLARELISNLAYLDDWTETLLKNVKGEQQAWRSGLLTHVIMDRCVDPSTGRLLTESEWLQANIGVQNTESLNRELSDTGDRVHTQPATLVHESRRVLDTILPVVAQTYVDLLCHVLAEKVRYAHSETQEVSLNLRSAWHDRALHSDRTWRTSTVPEGGWPDDLLIVWRDDRPERVPQMVKIVELRPKAEHSRIRSTSLDGGIGMIRKEVRARRAVRDLNRELKQMLNYDHEVRPIKRLSDSLLKEVGE
jgi:hypothetical protein